MYGNHPHVMQGAERYTTKDGRNTYVAYSIGSLTSGLGSAAKLWRPRTSFVLFLEFEKRPAQSKLAQVAAVRYVPICEVWRPDHTRAMLPTERVPGNKCQKEEAWAKYLLGEEDAVKLDDLPVVTNRGPWTLVGTPPPTFRPTPGGGKDATAKRLRGPQQH